MKKRMFSLVLCLVFIFGTVTAKDTCTKTTCPECHVISCYHVHPRDMHNMTIHIQIWAKQFANWWNSVSTPFDLNG
jgi:hypothetical protein